MTRLVRRRKIRAGRTPGPLSHHAEQHSGYSQPALPRVLCALATRCLLPQQLHSTLPRRLAAEAVPGVIRTPSVFGVACGVVLAALRHTPHRSPRGTIRVPGGVFVVVRSTSVYERLSAPSVAGCRSARSMCADACRRAERMGGVRDEGMGSGNVLKLQHSPAEKSGIVDVVDKDRCPSGSLPSSRRGG